ncbi:MAG: AAA family ATPase [Candidatus Omnitrophica bacterium]|nr:AAA family ATPase [Candidatus Omnitrophota bacterium]
MKIISIVNQKGGCGKTITAVNCAAALHKKGYKVLLVDCDPQAHATFSLRKESRVYITDILEAIAGNQELPSEGLLTQVADNFYLVPSRIGLASLEHKLSVRDDKLQILSSFLSKVSANFDYCLLDCPPNLGVLTLNALEASRYSLVPLMACDFSLRGIEILKDILIMLKEYKGSHPIPFYLLTQVDKRYNFSKEFSEKVKKQLGNLLLKSTIRINISLREAASAGKTIFEYKADSRGAEDFLALATELEKITSQSKWTSLFLRGDKFSEVYLVGDFNNWKRDERYRLNKVGEDIWSINVPLETGKYRYKFVAGDSWFNDPHNALAEDDAFGGKNSLLVIE